MVFHFLKIRIHSRSFEGDSLGRDFFKSTTVQIMLSENRRPSVVQTRYGNSSEEPENVENQHEPIDQGGIYFYVAIEYWIFAGCWV